MDTTDGALMSKAYGWAFSSPLRKIWYNITTTSLSVAVALLIGSIEIVQVLSGRLGRSTGHRPLTADKPELARTAGVYDPGRVRRSAGGRPG